MQGKAVSAEAAFLFIRRRAKKAAPGDKLRKAADGVVYKKSRSGKEVSARRRIFLREPKRFRIRQFRPACQETSDSAENKSARLVGPNPGGRTEWLPSPVDRGSQPVTRRYGRLSMYSGWHEAGPVLRPRSPGHKSPCRGFRQRQRKPLPLRGETALRYR